MPSSWHRGEYQEPISGNMESGLVSGSYHGDPTLVATFECLCQVLCCCHLLLCHFLISGSFFVV